MIKLIGQRRVKHFVTCEHKGVDNLLRIHAA